MKKKKNLLRLLYLAGISANFLAGQSTAPEPTAMSDSPSRQVSSEDLDQLRQRIAQQEEQIKNLQRAVDEQRTLLDRAMRTTSSRPANETSGASAASAAKAVPVANVIRPDPSANTGGGQKTETAPKSPLAITIGNTTFTPLGFVDASFFGRSTNVGSGIGTNFGSIPYNTSATGHISEVNFSTQNSRIGFRVDSTFLGAQVLGYFEADFLGTQPANVFVTSNSDTFRMRNIFVDVRKGAFEVLGGQDWSFLTPNRKGLSPLPSDIFYTLDMDTNYQLGLVWSRQSQFRFIAHPTENFAFGVSLENPQQYVGGSAGGSLITPPAAYTSLLGTQIDNGTSNYGAANLHPDIVFKAAYDAHAGEKIEHIEAAALIRSFKFAAGVGKPVTYPDNTTTAAAGEVNGNFEVAKNFRLIANTFFGSGNGRYVFGQAPDFIIRADGTISPIHTYSTVDGFEANITKNTVLYGYYGAVYIDRNTAFDTNGAPIGYGYKGSPASQNRAIQEGTIGIVRTLWKNPNYGALSLITQYSYLTRDPWSVVLGAPKEAHTNMYWADLRYTLP